MRTTSMFQGASSRRSVAHIAASGLANGGVNRAPAGPIITIRPCAWHSSGTNARVTARLAAEVVRQPERG